VLPHKKAEGEFASLNPLFLLFLPEGSLKQAFLSPGEPADSGLPAEELTLPHEELCLLSSTF